MSQEFQKSLKKLYALFIGINAYPDNPLRGCINDVLVISDYLKKLCLAQSPTVQPEFTFLLAPHEEEKVILASKGLREGMDYEQPSLQRIMKAFEDHFGQARPREGDFCLLYFSGHGTVMAAPPVFSEVEPTGYLQCITLQEKDEEGRRHIVDKELGYLIARLMENKGPDEKGNIPGVHFLSIMDCCYSGSNTRYEEGIAVRRSRNAPAIDNVEKLLGFSPGNIYYEELEESNGEFKIPRGGIKHGRHLSISAARNVEKAIERTMEYKEEQVNGEIITKERRQGIFTYSLIRTLEESGTNITYGELIRRVKMQVRSMTENQIPVLESTFAEEEDLLFLNNEFQTPAKVYEVAYRTGNWYMNAGAINGLVEGNDLQPTTIKLKASNNNKNTSDISHEKTVSVLRVFATECLLDLKALQEIDKSKLWLAIIDKMPFPRIRVGLADDVSLTMRENWEAAFNSYQPRFVANLLSGQSPDYIIKSRTDKNGNENFVLTRPHSDIPLFIDRRFAQLFVRDVDAVGKWSGVLKMDNSAAEEVKKYRNDLRIDVKTLEGTPFDRKSFNKIPEQQYQAAETPNPKSIQLTYKKIMKKGKMQYQQPAIKIKITNESTNNDYWVGALYLDSRFGIDHRYTPVQKLSQEEYRTFIELRFHTKNSKGGYDIFEGIPVFLDKGYHRLGVTEVTDYLIIFVSNKTFDLSQYAQKSLPLPGPLMKDAGFPDEGEDEEVKKDFWFTIKIPIHVHFPIDKVEASGDATPISQGISVECPANFKATFQPFSRKSVKQFLKKQSNATKALIDIQTVLPTGIPWKNVGSSDAVLSRGLANADPEDYIELLELTNIEGREQLSETTPLRVILDETVTDNETIVPYAFDPKSKIYFPIGFTDQEGRVVITTLPKATSGNIGAADERDALTDADKDLWSSTKLFFHKVILSRFTGRHDYNSLSLVQLNAKNELERIDYRRGKKATYLEAKEYIREKIELLGENDEVLLLVHGLIGHTSHMEEGFFNHTSLYSRFSAVLTFNYENLNSPLEDLGRELADMLHEVRVRQRNIVLVAHSMGGLVSRWFLEQEGGDRFVKKFIQVGTPNGGSVIAKFRKQMSNTLLLGLNGLEKFQPLVTIGSFIFRGLENQYFRTVNQMEIGSEFMKKLNSPRNSRSEIPTYYLIAGQTSTIEANFKENDPVWKKVLAGLKDRGKYLLFDQVFFDNELNDWIVSVETMKEVPDGHEAVVSVDCDHFGYFDSEQGLKSLKSVL